MKKLYHLLVIFLSIQGLQAQSVKHGILDLRDIELHDAEVYLNGEWEFYWQQLLTPEEIRKKQTRDFYPFPEIWNGGATKNGQPIDVLGFATYRVSILLPKQRPKLSLYIKHVYSSANLWINGEFIDFGGTPGKTEETSEPKWIPEVIEFNSSDADTLELVLQISNFEHRKGGAREPISLGDEKKLDEGYSQDLFYDLLLTGTLIMTGLFFMGIYFFGQGEKSALYFALFCLGFSYRVIGADDYVITILAPDMNWLIFLKLEYLSLFVPPLFFALFTHALYPFRYKINPYYIFAAISGMLAVVTIVFPSRVFTLLVEPYLALITMGILLAGITYVRAYRAKMDGSFYALISSGVVLMVFLYDILIYLGLTVELEAINFFGYLGFFFFQSLILFFLFTNSLKKAKEQAELAVAAKTDFLSTISHEIRTPLNAVVGISHFLLEDKPRKDQRDNLVSLKYSAEHLTTLINDILDYNKLESGFVEFEEMDTDLRELLHSIHKSYKPKADAKGIDLSLEFDEALSESVILDKTRMTQILSNLTDNAIKFTRNGGVVIRVKKLNAEEGYTTIRFEIEDTGIGIPKEKQKVIFERFTQASSSTTREFGGTGLGLAIIKRLLDLQGVVMHVDSEPGKGSRFFFDQRLKKGKPLVVNTSTMDSKYFETKLRGKRVLLVEDNSMNVVVARQFLKRWHMDLDFAVNGLEAVQKASENFYDVILMDLQMPEMDGYTAAKEIRGQKNPVPIIALTASALVSIQEKVLMSGMNDYITKPFDPEELKQKLAKNIRA